MAEVATAGERPSQCEPRLGEKMSLHEGIVGQIAGSALKQGRKAGSRLTEPSRDMERVPGPGAAALQRSRGIDETEYLDGHHERPAHRVAADEFDAVHVGQREQPVRETLEPVLVRLRQRQRQQRPCRLAHPLQRDRSG